VSFEVALLLGGLWFVGVWLLFKDAE